jgi:four helix bundle protein
MRAGAVEIAGLARMTNDQAPMSNQISGHDVPEGRAFHLAERTATFAESVIQFSRTIRRDAVNMPIISQLVRSATSIGANYLEADEAGSKKEFSYRISVCRREARETQYWLQVISGANPEVKEVARKLWKETHEFVLIFESIHRKASKPTR